MRTLSTYTGFLTPFSGGFRCSPPFAYIILRPPPIVNGIERSRGMLTVGTGKYTSAVGERLNRYPYKTKRTPLSHVISSEVEKSPMEETRTLVHNYPKYSPAVAHRPLVAETTVFAPRSQHSCFALAKNSHLRTVFTALRAVASRRSIPTVTSFPRNDKLYTRARRLIRI